MTTKKERWDGMVSVSGVMDFEDMASIVSWLEMVAADRLFELELSGKIDLRYKAPEVYGNIELGEN